MTRCRYVCEKFIKSCFTYSCVGGSGTSYSIADRVHGPIYQVPSLGWKSGTLSDQLAGINSRPMGLTNRGWLPIRIAEYAISGQTSSADAGFATRTDPNNSRGFGTFVQGSNNRNKSGSRQICFPNFSGREKGWGTETGGEFKGSKPVCKGRTFQDGGSTPTTRPYTSGGLDDKVRPKGCLSAGPYPSGTSKISSFSMEQQVVSVYMSPIWSLGSPQSIYKTPQTSGRGFEADGMSSNNLSGRYLDSSPGQGSVTSDHTISMPAVGVSGVVSEQQEIIVNTMPAAGVPGIPAVFPDSVDVSSSGENEKDPAGCYQNPSSGSSSAKRGSPVCGEISGTSSSFSHSSFTLQSPTVCNEFSPHRYSLTRGHGEEVRLHAHDECGRQSRPDVVEVPVNNLCGDLNPTAQSIGSHRVRCFDQGLGSSIEWTDSYRGSLVGSGGLSPHQLPGTFGGFSSNKSLWQRLEGHGSPGPDGQFHGSNVSQSERGYLFQTAMPTSLDCVGMVFGEKHHSTVRTPPRSVQSDSGHGIENSKGSMRLDAQSSNFPENCVSNGPTRSGPICFKIDQTASPFLQLEAGPRSGGHRCLSTELGSSSGICQPTLVSVTPLFNQGKSGVSENGPDNTIMEDSVMVPNSLGVTGGLPKDPTSTTRSNNDTFRSGVSDAPRSPKSDRLAYLRESYASQGFSTEASDLLLASWRPKTNSNYGSSFARWASWCEQRGRDPTSGPVSDIVNFLAELFNKGYQYQSLNSYRSAISSTHERIDGFSVGQHPAITRALKGVYHSRPPLPRYSSFWDVGLVVRYLKGLGKNEDLSLRLLTLKTSMLMALTRPSRSVDLSNLDIQTRSFVANGVVFRPAKLSKQSRPSRPLADFVFPVFQEDETICPVTTLKAYEARTEQFRHTSSGEFKSKLFLSWIGQHNPVTSSTMARWLRTCMAAAGIDISIFKPHSIRGASCSKAAGAGVTIKDILDAADWSSEGTFQRFYHRQEDDRLIFGSAVLSSQGSSKSTC